MKTAEKLKIVASNIARQFDAFDREAERQGNAIIRRNDLTPRILGRRHVNFGRSVHSPNRSPTGHY